MDVQTVLNYVYFTGIWYAIVGLLKLPKYTYSKMRKLFIRHPANLIVIVEGIVAVGLAAASLTVGLCILLYLNRVV